MSIKKVIDVFLKNGRNIQLEDIDPLNIDSYTKDLSNVFEIHNVFILSTTSGNLICRPSEICGVLVQEKVENQEQIKNKEEIIPEEQEDFITDGE